VRHRLTPYVLLAVLVLGTGFGIGLGLSKAPTAGFPPKSASVATRLPQYWVTEKQLQHALSLWKSFPVNGRPRPIVLAGAAGNIATSPYFGFLTGDNKIAFMNGQVDPPSAFPSSPTTLDGLPIMPAEEAFRVLTQQRIRGPATTTRLSVTSVSLGQADFVTDRGTRSLPAWLFSFAGVVGTYSVLAVGPPSLFSSPQSAYAGTGSATIDRTGRRISFFFGGVPIGNGPCTASYRPVYASSGTAVAIGQDVIALHSPPKGEACAAAARTPQHLRITLPKPLGPRVLIDAVHGDALPVTKQAP
jgi:hypothetical protein